MKKKVHIKNFKQPQELISWAKTNQSDLIITATKNRAKELFQQGGALIFAPHIFTIEDFAMWLYQKKDNQKKIINPFTEQFIVKTILKDNHTHFKLLKNYSLQDGLEKSLTQYFDHQIVEEDFNKQKTIYDDELQQLSYYYHSFLTKNGLITKSQVLLKALELLKQGQLKFELLVIDSFNFFSKLEQKILRSIIDNANSTYFFNDLKLPKTNISLSIDDFFAGLDQLDFDELLKNVNANEKKFFLAGNEEEEINFSAHKIIELLKDGYSQEDILVLIAPFTDYQLQLRDVFNQYGLEADFTRGLPLKIHPLTLFFQSLLNLFKNVQNEDNYQKVISYQPFSKNHLSKADLIQELTAISKLNDPAVWGEALKSFLKQQGLIKNLMSFQQDKNEDLVAENMTVLSKIVSIIDEVIETYKIKNRRVNTEDLIDLLKKKLDSSEYYLLKAKKGITVSEILNIRGFQGKILFILGAVENFLPRKSEFNFLSAGQVSTKNQFREGQFTLFKAITNFEQVYLLSPKFIKDQEVQTSILLTDFKQIPLTSSTHLYNQEQLLTYLANNLEQKLWQNWANEQAFNLLQRKASLLQNQTHYNGKVAPKLYQSAETVAYSASMLETFQSCPFRYLLEYLIKIEPLTEISWEPNKKDWGELIHQILDEFGSQNGFAALIKDDFNTAKDLLTEIVEHSLKQEQLSLENPFIKGLCQKWFGGLILRGEQRGVLLDFLVSEQAKDKDIIPQNFELRFGPTENIKTQLGGFQLKGRIDRLDKIGKTQQLIIYDYKTGKIPAKKKIANQESLQLAFYLLALQSNPNFKDKSLTAYFYGLSPQKRLSCSQAVITDSESFVFGKKGLKLCDLDQPHLLISLLQSLEQATTRGHFPIKKDLDPFDDCEYCPYFKACRISEQAYWGLG